MFSSFTRSFRAGRRPAQGVVLDDIILHYRSDDQNSYSGSGSIINDLTDNLLHGTIVNGPTYSSNYFTWTSSDYIITPDLDSEITASQDSHSLEMWIYPTGNGVVATYVGQTNPYTGYHHSAIEIVNGNLEIGLWNGGSITSTGNLGAVSFNEWHQVVLTYDGIVARGYIDGSYAGQVSVSWASPMNYGSYSAFHIAVGASDITNQGDGTQFDGRFGIMRLYGKALSANEVLKNYNEDANSFSNPWSPSTDISPVVWIDASDSNNYTTSGVTLTGVTDKAGTYTMTVNNTPTVVSGGLNGMSVFDFDGNNEYIQSTSYESQVDGSGNHWAIGLFLADTVDGTKDSFWSYETNQSPKRDYAISSGASNNTWPGELDLDALSSNRISSAIGNKQSWNSSISMDNWHIVVAIFNKTGNQIAQRVDGANAFTPVNDYDNSLSTNQELRLMRNRASQELDGRLAEFFAVADLPGSGGVDISDVEKAEGYLAHKWGVQSLLPLGHPYKSDPP